jgi:hypothetical protein
MLNEITLLYARLDDILKGIGHSEDIRSQMSDAEVMTRVNALKWGMIRSIKTRAANFTVVIN